MKLVFLPWVVKSWEDFVPLKKWWFWKVLCFCGNSKCHEICYGACAWMSAEIEIEIVRYCFHQKYDEWANDNESNEQRFVAQYICSLLMDEISEWCKISLSEAIPLKSWECKILKDLQRRRICQIGTIRISGKPPCSEQVPGQFPSHQ